MTTHVTRAKFALQLLIGDSRRDGAVLEVSAASATFEMNRIPFASVTVGVGRNAVTGRVAEIHRRLNRIGPMAPARLVLIPSGQWSASEGQRNDTPTRGLWDRAGAQVIFDGYVTGAGVKRVRGQFSVTLQLIHWLSDLAFSSIFSEQSHPGNPANLTHNAVYRTAATGTTNSQAAFISGTRFFNKFSEAAIQQDLWTSLANVFCQIANEDLVQLGPPGQCGGLAGRSNALALSALARMQGRHDCAARGVKRHVPLSMDNLGPDGGAIAKAINQYVGKELTQLWWSTTLWDKLVNDLAPRFMFHIVPLVDTALAVPWIAGLRSHWTPAITAQDHAQLFVTSYVRRPLRAVGIYGGRDVGTVPSEPNPQNISALSGIGSCFMPDPDRRGMILLKEAPEWMSSVPNFIVPASTTTRGGRSALQPTGSATTFRPARDPTAPSKSTAAVNVNDLYGRLAQYIYMLEVLRGRTGVLTGKFRLDIAPGSTIKLEQRGDPFVRGAGFTNDLFASVMRVSYGLDAESAQAMTVMQLAHLRSPSENEDDAASVDEHPLYSGAKFLGAPLVEQYHFADE